MAVSACRVPHVFHMGFCSPPDLRPGLRAVSACLVPHVFHMGFYVPPDLRPGLRAASRGGNHKTCRFHSNCRNILRISEARWQCRPVGCPMCDHMGFCVPPDLRPGLIPLSDETHRRCGKMQNPTWSATARGETTRHTIWSASEMRGKTFIGQELARMSR